MTDIKFAVVGTGLMAATMMSAFAKAGIRVTAVVSRDHERARRFAQTFSIPVSETNVGSVVKRSDVDAVYIANAPHEHAKTSIAALEAGKAVLCEKPMALSHAEALLVVAAARKARTLFMEGLWTLFLPAYDRIFESARKKEIGELRSLVADFGYPLSEEGKRYQSGGVLLDRGIYLIALALSLLGPAVRVDALLGFTSAGLDEEAFLQLHHKNGGHSQLAASFTGLMSNTASLSCSRGLIKLESPLIGSEKVSVLVARPVHPNGDAAQPPSLRAKIIRKLRESPRMRLMNQAIKKPTLVHAPFGHDQYLPELHHFLNLVQTGVAESNIASLQLSLDIQSIIERARTDHVRLASG